MPGLRLEIDLRLKLLALSLIVISALYGPFVNAAKAAGFGNTQASASGGELANPPAPSIWIKGNVKDARGRVDLHIEFICNDSERFVNMESLSISYMNMFGVDVTHLVRPYIRQNKIIADGLEFPPGEHEFLISIRDDKDIETARSISFQVH